MDEGTIQSPQPPNQSPTPIKPNNKFPLVILIVVGLASVGYFASAYYFTLWPFRTPTLTNDQGQPSISTAISSSIISNKSPLYYYDSDFNLKKFSITKFSTDINSTDVKIFESDKALNFYDNYLSPDLYLVGYSDGSVYTFNVANNNLTKIFGTDTADTEVSSAKLSQDKKKIAYSVYNNEQDDLGQIWVYDIASGGKVKIVEIPNLGIYVGLNVLGWDSDGNIIFRGMGGDGPAIWGDVYRVSSNTETKYETIEVADSVSAAFLIGELSPDGTKWLYNFCQKPDANPSPDYSWFNPCTDGGQIFIYDLKTKTYKSLYRNLTHDNNTLKGKLRVIFSSSWVDDKTIVFTMADGLYKLNINEGPPEEMLKFDWSDPDSISQNPTFIFYADKDYVVLEKYNDYAVIQVVDLASRKVAEINDYVEGFFR